MQLQKRSSFGWGPTGAGKAHPTNGLVVHFDGYDQGLAGQDHSACVSYWKATRRFHMGPERGWADIGYSFGVCPHGKVMEGRGVGHVQAAQPGGNATWYSVTFMSGPGEKPTAAQTGAFRALRSWLRVSHGVRAAVTYHGKFTSTDCPGSILKRMVLNGSLLAGDPSTKPPKPKPTGKAPAWPGVYLTQPPAKEQKGARTWQQQMAKRGWRISVDGVYGPESEKVCRSFQRQAGLLEDGIVGPIVWRRSWSEPIR